MNFPNRPDHPDFWLLAEIVQDFDSAADDGTQFDRLVKPIVDVESLTYVAEQRVLRMQMAINPLIAQSPAAQSAKIGGAWIDGFVAGALFQKRRMKSK